MGYIINKEGITLDEGRLDVIKNFPTSKRTKDVRSFLGLLNYYNRFIPDYSNKTLPLLELQQKNIKWTWSSDQETAFKNLKFTFVQNLSLYHSNFAKEFLVRIDASDNAAATELIQYQDDLEVSIQFFFKEMFLCCATISSIIENNNVNFP